MPAKPIPGLGLVLGVIAGYATMVGASLAMTKLAAARAQMLKATLDQGLPWLGLLLAVALVLSVLMAAPAIGAGVMTGAGAFMTVFGLVFVLLPMRQTFDLVKLFRIPGTGLRFSYSLLDGSFVLLGIVVLVVGVRRWASDAKVYRLLTAQGQAQDRAYNPALGGQQWGGYPGQQQSPGQQPQPGQPQHGQQPQQPQYGGYPGQQQQGGYPGQQQPQHYGQQPPGQQPPGGHPGQQQPPR
jgi:hypothetical protein